MVPFLKGKAMKRRGRGWVNWEDSDRLYFPTIELRRIPSGEGFLERRIEVEVEIQVFEWQQDVPGTLSLRELPHERLGEVRTMTEGEIIDSKIPEDYFKSAINQAAVRVGVDALDKAWKKKFGDKFREKVAEMLGRELP